MISLSHLLVDFTFLDVLLHLRAGSYHPDTGSDEGAALCRRHVHLRRRLGEQPPLVGLGLGGRGAVVIGRVAHADLAGDDGTTVGR